MCKMSFITCFKKPSGFFQKSQLLVFKYKLFQLDFQNIFLESFGGLLLSTEFYEV